MSSPTPDILTQYYNELAVTFRHTAEGHADSPTVELSEIENAAGKMYELYVCAFVRSPLKTFSSVIAADYNILPLREVIVRTCRQHVLDLYIERGEACCRVTAWNLHARILQHIIDPECVSFARIMPLINIDFQTAILHFTGLSSGGSYEGVSQLIFNSDSKINVLTIDPK